MNVRKLAVIIHISPLLTRAFVSFSSHSRTDECSKNELQIFMVHVALAFYLYTDNRFKTLDSRRDRKKYIYATTTRFYAL